MFTITVLARCVFHSLVCFSVTVALLTVDVDECTVSRSALEESGSFIRDHLAAHLGA